MRGRPRDRAEVLIHPSAGGSEAAGTLPRTWSEPWPEPSTDAMMLPLASSGETGRTGVLIVGLNPFRLYDDGYAGFLELAEGLALRGQVIFVQRGEVLQMLGGSFLEIE